MTDPVGPPFEHTDYELSRIHGIDWGESEQDETRRRGEPSLEDELAKVLVKGNQHPSFASGDIEDRGVGCAWCSLPDPDNIVASTRQRSHDNAWDVLIGEEPHRRPLGSHGVDARLLKSSAGVMQAGAQILLSEARVVVQNLLVRPSLR